MRILRWRVPTIFSKIALLAVGGWLSLGVIQQIVNLGEGDPVYHWLPWDDSMDKKMFRVPSNFTIDHAEVQDDTQYPGWNPSNLQKLLESPTTLCRRLKSLGGLYDCRDCNTCKIDGNKYVCFDDDVGPTPGDCLIYSFGIGGEISWDRAMLKFNCSVYAFDMTTDWKNGVYGGGFHFLTLGLFPDDFDSKLKMSNGAKEKPSVKETDAAFRTLATIRDILGHKERPIDILKMDIENAEWGVFESILNSTESRKVLSDVKQIALEIHLDDFKNSSAAGRVAGGRRIEKILTDLYDYGFQLAHTELNTAFQVHAEVRGQVVPLFRESLFVHRS